MSNERWHPIPGPTPVAEAGEDLGEIREALRDVFAIQDTTQGIGGSKAIRLRGRLLVESHEAYQWASERLGRLGYTVLFRRVGETDVIVLTPAVFDGGGSRTGMAAVLLVLTVASTLFAGANPSVIEARGWFWGMLSGWPFALSFLAILMTHELGHYFTARHFGVAVSLPFFIPMPFNLLGTMGAFIRMKAPPRDRRQLLAIAAAGPLAGLVVAIPVLVIGLLLSKVEVVPQGGGYLVLGDSLLGVALQRLVFRGISLGTGEDIFLHGVALAGWAGLLVTAMNLLPMGQLDGGHVAYAVLGNKAKRLHGIMLAILFGLGFLWDGWFFWAVLGLLFGRFAAVPLDDITRVGPRGRAVAAIVAVAFILVFVPVPLRVVPGAVSVP